MVPRRAVSSSLWRQWSCSFIPPRRRCFATTVFNLPPVNQKSREQVLFLLGVNQGKFFGRDSSEEGLKLLERIAEHDQEYTLLLGITKARLKLLESEHSVKNNRLTPSRQLESERSGELIPLMQACSLDNRPRHAVDRDRGITGERVAQLLAWTPNEGIKLYWAVFAGRQQRDVALYEFWRKHFPRCSQPYFEQRAEFIALRALEHITSQRDKGRGGSTLLVVGNDLYGAVLKQLEQELQGNIVQALSSGEISRARTARLKELNEERFALHRLLFHVMFLYVGMPLLVLLQIIMACSVLLNSMPQSAWRRELESRE